MRGRALLLEHGPRLHRAALVEDGRLEALEIDLPGETLPQPGVVYAATVAERLPGLGAAFLDLGGGATAFLPDAAEARPGDALTVQIRREPEEGKAARAAHDIQLPGRFLVFTPMKPGINVSRKLADAAERTRLADALKPFSGEGGFVVRTHAAGCEAAALRADAEALTARWRAAQARGAAGRGLLLPGASALARLLAGLGGALPPLHANPAATEALSELQPATVSPHPFDDFDIEPQIAALLHPRADLREGWIAIEPTAALVAVDVNTGGAKAGEAARRVNLAAAEALPRQLALRRLGGSVMIDFAASPSGASERRRLEQALSRAASGRIEGLRVLGWGPAGLLEVRCPRPARALADLLKGTAP